MKDKGIVIKDISTNEYYCGMNEWNIQLRKAKIYHSKKYANKMMDDTRFRNRNKILVNVEIKEV